MSQVFDGSQQVVVAEGLAQHPAIGESRCQVGVRSGGNIEQSHGTGKIQKKLRLIGDQQIRTNFPLAQQFTGAQCFANYNFETVPLQYGPKETADKWVFRDQNPGGTWERIYCFADGRVLTEYSADGNFDAFEKQHMVSSPNQ